jgi:general secretion pathway protein H
MPTSPLLRVHRSLQRAFTLIEVLVVVVIIGIVVSVAVLSVNVLGRDNQLNDETERLQALFALVREQAEMQNRDHALRLEETGYQFLRLDVRTGEWRAVDGDKLMRRHSFPPGVHPRLFLEAREVTLKPPADKKAPWPPQVMVLSSGDLTAFELKLEREDSDNEATMLGKVDGTIEIRKPDEAAG